MAIQRRDNLRVFGPIIAELKKKQLTTYIHTKMGSSQVFCMYRHMQNIAVCVYT